jgi:hypothetical protein
MALLQGTYGEGDTVLVDAGDEGVVLSKPEVAPAPA